MNAKVKTATSVTSYLEIIFKMTPIRNGIRCYRGHASATHSLKPSVMRDIIPNDESKIFSALTLEIPTEFANDKLMFDKLVRAQHYGLPTRLLDVSHNPLVSLYFACKNEKYHNEEGSVHILDFPETRIKYADSDAISLISNLARLSESEREEIRDFRQMHKDTLLSKWTTKMKSDFRRLKPMKRLFQFVRAEKPYFLDTAMPIDLFRYFFVHPAKNNHRITAQSGAFMVAGLLPFSSPESNRQIKMRKIIIPPENKSEILNNLDALNINSKTMFPEIQSVSQYIKEKWKKQK